MSLEEDLRTTLRDRAADSAPQPDLWASVTDGVHRDQRRRRAMVAVAVALVVGAAGVAVPLLNRDHGRRPSPPVVQKSDGWAPPSWSEPVFPLTPTWVPEGLGQGIVTQLGPNVSVEFRKGESILSAEIGPLPADWESEGEEDHHATINGIQADVRTAGQYDGSSPGDRYVGIRWQRPDRQWITVLSWGKRTENDVLRFARGLAPTGSLTATKAPFTFATVPPGLTLMTQIETMTCLAPPDLAAKERTPQIVLCVSLQEDEDSTEAPPMENLTINGQPAIYYEESHRIVIDRPGTACWVIDWDSETIPLTRDEAIRFATGIS